VLAVLASRLDPAAHALVDAWSSAGAALLSAEDLGSLGWSYHLADPGAGSLVIEGQRVAARKLRAVITRRPAVVAEELDWIEASDRGYVAAEMNAFLVAWLTALPCPVLNRPSPRSLTGPAWGPIQWAAAAAQVGVAWSSERNNDMHDVVVCAGDCVGARSAGEEVAARALAEAAGVELLGVRFSASGACAATPMPSLDDEAARAGVLRRVVSGPQ
jgi:hypothetical protein